MSELKKVTTLIDQHGNTIQAVQPGSTLSDGPELLVTGLPNNYGPVETEAVYIYCKSVVHVRYSKEGDPANAWNAPIDASSGVFIPVRKNDIVSVLLMEGESENLIWVCGVN